MHKTIKLWTPPHTPRHRYLQIFSHIELVKEIEHVEALEIVLGILKHSPCHCVCINHSHAEFFQLMFCLGFCTRLVLFACPW